MNSEIYEAIEQGLDVIRENQLHVYRKAIETLQGAGFLVLEDPEVIEQLSGKGPPTDSIQIELCMTWKALGRVRQHQKEQKPYPPIGGKV